jgi:hypothetical protein
MIATAAISPSGGRKLPPTSGNGPPLLGFIALTAVMFATLKVDWSRLGGPTPEGHAPPRDVAQAADVV